MVKRRDFIKNIALAGVAAGAVNIAKAEASVSLKAKKITLPDNPVILFQGDSITDAKREKKETVPNSIKHLGEGYVGLAAAKILKALASKAPEVYNKGVGGNKVYQLIDRWEEDCISLKPDVLSILIGVNDFWHTRDGKFDSTPESYERDYRRLLELTIRRLPNIKLVIGEPFAILGSTKVDQSWYPAFNEYRRVAKKIAGEFGAVFIPYQAIFEKAIRTAPAPYWTRDGVHVTLAGAELMAQAWMESVRW